MTLVWVAEMHLKGLFWEIASVVVLWTRGVMGFNDSRFGSWMTSWASRRVIKRMAMLPVTAIPVVSRFSLVDLRQF